MRLIDQFRNEALFWFLTSKGFRTYRYLPLFFRHYYPKWNEPCPLEVEQVVEALGRLVAGDRYDPSRRIVSADAKKYYAREAVAAPGLRVKCDAHVRFFIEQNPGYARGDELCCLAPLSLHNFTRAAYRVINTHANEREAI